MCKRSCTSTAARCTCWGWRAFCLRARRPSCCGTFSRRRSGRQSCASSSLTSSWCRASTRRRVSCSAGCPDSSSTGKRGSCSPTFSRLSCQCVSNMLGSAMATRHRGPGKYSPQWTARSNGAKTSCCCRVLPKVEHLIRQAREGRRPPWRREEVVLTLGHPLQSYVLTGVTPASERCRSPRQHCPVTWRGHDFSPLARLNRSGQANFSQYKAKSIMSSF
mmetsp:Transcript_43766/g.108891  ORF Transcript_43766/g.108891 Transcript_43766/m.108891 type:complete len:219 (+) Transcript_43766:208-864(+)